MNGAMAELWAKTMRNPKMMSSNTIAINHHSRPPGVVCRAARNSAISIPYDLNQNQRGLLPGIHISGLEQLVAPNFLFTQQPSSEKRVLFHTKRRTGKL
jgi:hypothetical protein